MKLICPICNKTFLPHRPNQVVCGSAQSTCKRKYKYLQRHGKLDNYYGRNRAQPTLDPILSSFLTSHPASVQEVIQDESIPNIGISRSVESGTKNDLHSVLKSRRLYRSLEESQR